MGGGTATATDSKEDIEHNVKMNDRIKIAIVGYGNVGRGVHKAIERNPDTTLVGIITRRPNEVARETHNTEIFSLDSKDYQHFGLCKADVLILCGGSKNDLPHQGPFFARYFNTVDSFDTHANIPAYFAKMDETAKANNHVSVISAGWDPGTFSIEKALADAFIPEGKHYAFWGPGVSQGHSDAARQVEGVRDARAYTFPIQEAIEKVRAGGNPDLTAREKHYRIVKVTLEEGIGEEDKKRIEHEIKTMKDYYADYNTIVDFISEGEMKKEHSAYPHKGSVIATGNTGDGNKAKIEYRCEWGSNPESTGNILVACARAAYRLGKEGKSGAFTMLDIPASYFSSHSQEELLNFM